MKKMGEGEGEGEGNELLVDWSIFSRDKNGRLGKYHDDEWMISLFHTINHNT